MEISRFVGKCVYSTYGHTACIQYVDKIANMYVVKIQQNPNLRLKKYHEKMADAY